MPWVYQEMYYVQQTIRRSGTKLRSQTHVLVGMIWRASALPLHVRIAGLGTRLPSPKEVQAV